MEPWQKLPLEHLRDIHELELYAGQHHRPVYTWFRSFGRRPGSLVRFLLLASLTDSSVQSSDILEYDESTGWDGLYLDEQPLEYVDATVIDPMLGSGSTVFEGSRLGLDVMGFEYNPVMWWVVRQTARNPGRQLEEDFAEFQSEVQEEVGGLFGNDGDETVLSYLLALTIHCPTCHEKLELHRNYELSNNDEVSTYLCPNPACDNRVIKRDTDRDEEIECDTCHAQFVPEDGNFSYGTFHCSRGCGREHSLFEYFDNHEIEPTFNRYAVYYKNVKSERRYRPLDDTDQAAIEEAQRRYREHSSELLLPSSKIEKGKHTAPLLNLNLFHYRALFTERQLVVFSTLFSLAHRQSPDATAEQLVTIVASMLHYNNLLTTWNSRMDRAESVFKTHNHQPGVETVEVNPLAPNTYHSLDGAFERFEGARSYIREPTESLKFEQSKPPESIALSKETLDPERILRVEQASADRLDVDPESIECGIFDPPHYDSVQHGELHDFYYVWLREVLGDRYEEFSTTHVPKLREIAVNQEREKDTEYYYRALRNALEEIHRILVEDGQLIYLMTLSDSEMWSNICSALIRAGFQIRGASPYYKMDDDVSSAPAKHSVALFTKKSSEDDEISMPIIRQNLLYDLAEMADEERAAHSGLSNTELRIILWARGLAEFSEYYPNVYRNEEQVDASAGVEMIQRVVNNNIPQSEF